MYDFFEYLTPLAPGQAFSKLYPLNLPVTLPAVDTYQLYGKVKAWVITTAISIGYLETAFKVRVSPGSIDFNFQPVVEQLFAQIGFNIIDTALQVNILNNSGGDTMIITGCGVRFERHFDHI